MDKAYTKQTFVDDSAPYLCATNLNQITTGLDTVDNRVITHDTSITTNTTNLSTLDTYVHAIFSFDSETNTLNITASSTSSIAASS